LYYSPSRLVAWRGRRPLSLMLGLVYFCAFVALGLIHRHTGAPMAPYPAARAAVTSIPAATSVVSTVTLAQEPACWLCATASAATTTLVEPPVAVQAPVSRRVHAATYTPAALTRTFLSSPPRGPPQAC
jgi:hypothetical protein